MKRNPAAGTVLLVVILVFFIPIFQFLFRDLSDSNKTDSPAPKMASTENEEPSAADPIEISSVDLYAAYTENEVNADNLYKDKILSVTGVITNIGKDMVSGAPCVSLDSGSQYSLYPIQCFFPKSDEHSEEIGALKDGQTITIVGKCTGIFVANVQISDCSIYE